MEKGSSDFNSAIKQQALRFLDYILATELKQKYPFASILFCQYGRYVYKPRVENLLDLAKKYILKNHITRMSEKNMNRTFSFQRVTNKRVWDDVWIDVYGTKERNEYCEIKKVNWKTGFRTYSEKDSIILMVQETVGIFYYKLQVKSNYHLLKLLGLNPTSNEDIVYNEIKSAINEWERNQ